MSFSLFYIALNPLFEFCNVTQKLNRQFKVLFEQLIKLQICIILLAVANIASFH